jgi:hypothetical protein
LSHFLICSFRPIEIYTKKVPKNLTN